MDQEKPKKPKELKIMEVTIDERKSAVTTISLEGQSIEALVDTGAARCCINEEIFRTIPGTRLEPCHNLRIKTATGTPLMVMGIAALSFMVGQAPFVYNFLVCRNLKRKAILGIDFMRQNKIGTSWTQEGRFTLQYKNELLVESLEVLFDENVPELTSTKDLVIPSRHIAIVGLSPHLQSIDSGKMLETRVTLEFEEKHPNLITIPMVHNNNSNLGVKTPFVVINLSEEDDNIKRGEVVAEMLPIDYTTHLIKSEEEVVASLDIEDSDPMEADASVKLMAATVRSDKAFVTSPADVETHRKVQLQDFPLEENFKQQFRDLCIKHEEVFSKSSEDIGHTPLITMEVETGDHPPICQRPYNLALKHVDWVQQELEILEKAGVIERSLSPWASPIVIVPKKSEPGEPPRRRMCIDYRQLNGLLPPVKKAHSNAKGVLTLVPLPKIDEIYAKLKNSKVYSALDMRSGYYHIELSEESKPKTAFVVGGPHGSKYHFNRCPFGLTQAPAYFQALVTEVLRGLPYAFGYLDDILIFSPDPITHLQHLEEVFKRLKRADLKLKASKCSFFKQHIQYLGHLVSGGGIEPLPEKLQSVKAMPPPRNPKEIRQFLGLVGYYRKFIPKFADIARPLTNLTKKDIDFDWTNECQDTFQLLKDMLLKEPILTYPDPSLPYTLFTDASKYAWACVLTQEHEHEIEGKVKKVLHPITYASGLFKGSQINWATLTKEAYAIYMSVKKLSYYLEDADIRLMSDHLPLKKFLSKNTLNTKVNNWAVEISPYRIQFEYIKGIKNTLADTMSRLIEILPDIELSPEPEGQEFGYDVFEALEPIQTTSLSVSELKESILESKDPIPEDLQPITDLTNEQLQEIQRKDKFIKNILNGLKANKVVEGKPYYLEDNLLKKYIYDNKQRFEAIVVPPSCAPMLLKLGHDDIGHNGSARTYMLIKRLYYWKGIKKDVYRYVKQCKICQKHNIIPVKYTPGHFSVPKQPMEFISMDLIGEFHPSSKKNKYALTVICMLTGFTFCIPLKSKKAGEVVMAYTDEVYKYFGGSRKILSDNGTEFKNQLFEKVAKTLGVQFKCYTAPYHPQSNGRIEGFHHFLKACMAKHISGNLEWDEVIPKATAAYNFLPNEHSKESPFFLMFGRDPVLPLNSMFKPRSRYLGTDENILSLEALQQMYYLVAENLRMARERMTKNNQTYPNKLKTEDMVMIKDHTRKPFQPMYKGYYRIVAFKGNQVEVRHCKGGNTHFVHISDVKYVLPADSIIAQLPKFDPNIRKATLNLNPDKVPDLQWELATELNTKHEPPDKTIKNTQTKA